MNFWDPSGRFSCLRTPEHSQQPHGMARKTHSHTSPHTRISACWSCPQNPEPHESPQYVRPSCLKVQLYPRLPVPERGLFSPEPQALRHCRQFGRQVFRSVRVKCIRTCRHHRLESAPEILSWPYESQSVSRRLQHMPEFRTRPCVQESRTITPHLSLHSQHVQEYGAGCRGCSVSVRALQECLR